ncbi:hypothetical protein VW29_00690 [Devosia limi DSM 17137]|uniref:Uncharacterized protein n=1 Tax=Devosia limi DSM 17137 TaxID=1121477 RepID=A0A0F5LYT7_9HYPH|nr:hypothetical protein VW29_00690 [Devosia limi DSM 17137]
MLEEVSASQLAELEASFNLPIYLPSSESLLATELSFPMFGEIRGDQKYRNDLESLSNAVLDRLARAATPSIHSKVRRHLHEHRKSMLSIMHSLAHACSLNSPAFCRHLRG